VRHVLRSLEAAASRVQDNIVKFVYINTRLTGTEYRTLADFGNQIGVIVPFTGLAVSEVSSRIMSEIKQNSKHVILVLDEIDYLVNSMKNTIGHDNLLYDLTRANERLGAGMLSIIGISNDLKFKESLDPRVLSSLNEEELVFPPYTVEEIKSILLQRIPIAFRLGVVTDGAVNLAAALSAREHGDARRAVDLLRVAGEIADREGNSLVVDEHVRVAMNRIEQDRIVDALRSLPFHEKLVLLSCLGNSSSSNSGGYSTGGVYENYSLLCSRVATEPLTQRRVSGILSELDLQGIISADIVNSGRHGRTKKVRVLLAPKVIKEILAEDSMVNSLLT
jgi:cell division control protein 6